MTYMIQIDDVVRPATPEEAAAIEAIQSKTAAAEQEKLDKEATRQAALSKLGLTSDEVAALFG